MGVDKQVGGTKDSGITLDNLRISLKKNDIYVDNLHFGLGVYAIYGGNGMGKTTLLDVIAGELKPTSGSVRIGQETIYNNSRIRSMTAYAHAETILPSDEKVGEALFKYLYILGIDKSYGISLARVFGLSEFFNSPIFSLSTGWKRKLEIVRALSCNRRFILMDEPTSGVDSAGVSILVGQIEKLRQSSLVILVTHDREFLQELKPIIFNLRDGSLFEETRGVDKLRESDNMKKTVCISMRGWYPSFYKEIQMIPGIESIRFRNDFEGNLESSVKMLEEKGHTIHPSQVRHVFVDGTPEELMEKLGISGEGAIISSGNIECEGRLFVDFDGNENEMLTILNKELADRNCTIRSIEIS